MALSTEDRALALAATRYAYANGWSPNHLEPGYVEWHRDGWMVDYYADGAGVQITAEDDNRRLGIWYPRTGSEAVDILAVLGVLPREMCSIWKAAVEQHCANLESLVPEVTP